MSLINKMLQDLESRKMSQADATSKKSVYEDLKPTRSAGMTAPSRRLTALVLVIVILGAGVFAWTQWGEMLLNSLMAKQSAPPTTTVAVRKPVPKPVQASGPTPPAVAMSTPVTAPEVTQTPAPPTIEIPSPETTTQTVPTAMRETVVATTSPGSAPKQTTAPAGQKSTPPSDSGYWIVSRGETLYGISVSTGIDLWDLSSWNHLGSNHVIYPGQRLRLTVPDAATLNQADKESVVQRASKKKSSPRVAAKKSSAEKISPPPSSSASQSIDTNAVDSSKMDRKLKPFSSDEKAENEYRQAVSYLQKGRAADAEKHLRSALKISPVHTGARELLAGLMLQRGKWREAEELLEQGIELVPNNYPFALLLARIAVEHGSDERALAVMEGSRRVGAVNSDYVGFLAALYQRSGKYPEAVAAYTEAIKLNPTEGRSWLGMAISLEAEENWNASGEAYQRAISTGTLDDNLLKYARQRLAVMKNK